jgi:diguanylate cyclase (GGDEF)-like protein
MDFSGGLRVGIGDPGSLSILLIEDSPGDRRLTEIALQQGSLEGQLRCELRSAATLAEGLALLGSATNKPDAVLLDLGLPDATGLDGLRALRNASPQIPIIVLTGLSDTDAATEALKYGASDYLEKGEVQPRTLLRAIRYAIERKKSEAELIHLAQTDSLTGLFNRRAFFEHLEVALAQARRSDLACAVILFDVDNFKETNDLFGHKAGDDLLVAVANAVREELRETDSIARIGGDEFAVLAANLKSASAAMEIAEKIIAAVRSINALDDARVEASISIGISVFPMDDNQADVLISHADMAMYKSKTGRKGTITFFDAGMDESVKVRHALRRRMPGEISTGKFYLVFQPIVDAVTREITGAEGLARWCGADGKIIYPGEFIAIAEESGAITSLGNRLFEEACGYIRQWRDAGNVTVPISLNISPIQLRDPTFGLQLIAKIEKFGIDSHLINIEITESTIIKNLEMTQKNLDLLKRYGVGVHIDDFGTGYSSLSLLKDLPLDALKIDQSFVRGLGIDAGAKSIVQAIVELSKKLGFVTIAEGVETEEQAVVLRDIGVNCLQGYYFSRPVEAKEFVGWLAKAGAHLVA